MYQVLTAFTMLGIIITNMIIIINSINIVQYVREQVLAPFGTSGRIWVPP